MSLTDVKLSKPTKGTFVFSYYYLRKANVKLKTMDLEMV